MQLQPRPCSLDSLLDLTVHRVMTSAVAPTFICNSARHMKPHAALIPRSSASHGARARGTLKLERPVGVDEGDGTLSVHPCHALFVAENSESRSPFSRHSGSYHFVCGSATPSSRPSSQASALVAKAACRPGPWTRRRLLPRSCIHLRTHIRAPAQPQQNTQQLSLTWIERLARR